VRADKLACVLAPVPKRPYPPQPPG
jgi:hypothetical protein